MIARLIYSLLRYTNLNYIFRYIFQKKRVTILMFHKPTVQSFELCLSYLKRNYNFISLHEYLDFRNGILKSLPDYSVIITLDDGHKSNYDLLPIVKKYNVIPTIFLTSGTVNTNRHYWTKYLKDKIGVLDAQKIPFNDLNTILDQNSYKYTNEYEERMFLNINEIVEMKDYFDFQSHTIFHPALPQCSNELSFQEISDSKKELESLLNKEVNSIAFPFGLYSEREIKNVKNVGYECAITVDYGFNNDKTDLFRLKRLSVNDTDDLNELTIKSSGVWGFIKFIIKKIH